MESSSEEEENTEAYIFCKKLYAHSKSKDRSSVAYIRVGP